MTQRAPEDWTRCPPGELGRLGERLRQRRQRRGLLRGSAVTGAAMVLVAAAALWIGWGGEPSFGGITCSEVIGAAADYRDDRLSDEVRGRVVVHVSECKHCREHYKGMGLIIQRSVMSSNILARWAPWHGSMPGVTGLPVPTVN